MSGMTDDKYSRLVSTVLKATSKLTVENHLGCAETMCQAVLASDNNNSSALNQLGVIKYLQGKVGEADLFFENALRNDHTNIDAALNRLNLRGVLLTQSPPDNAAFAGRGTVEGAQAVLSETMFEHFDNLKNGVEIKPGIPLASSCEALTGTELFKWVEAISNGFLAENDRSLTYYKQKWVKDPFHQWSRRWEYLFVLDEFYRLNRVEGKKKLRVLDGGSGLTFFPFLIASTQKALDIECCDYDDQLLGPFGEIVSRTKTQSTLNMSVADLRDLRFPDGAFDVIYSISVIEHNKELDKIVDEFYRILKPGGELILTFDISIDGSRDIPIDAAERLLGHLRRSFKEVESGLASSSLSDFINRNESLTTDFVRQNNPELLPFSSVPNVTCYCSVFRKAS